MRFYLTENISLLNSMIEKDQRSELITLGNESLLELCKIAFLCSRKVLPSVILKCYDWAIIQREAGNCIISGFHSQLEKDVLHYLLKGNQPIILALARGLKDKIEPEFQRHIVEGRLLIITPFDKQVNRVTEKTASTRNRMMIELADYITVGYISKGGALEKTLNDSKKEIMLL
jgi:predicted Rossmann fold nucleotide-binding protein DprA/Smf involved in DNA uptake